MENIKLFATKQLRSNYEDSTSYVEPYVSLEEESNEVSYNTISEIKVTVRDGATVTLAGDVILNAGVNIVNTKVTKFDIYNGKNNITEIDYSNYRGTDIPVGAFANSSLEKLIITGKVNNINAGAFRDVSSLRRAILTSVSTIADEAFSMCSNLQSIVVSNNLAEVGNNAFFHCNNLTDITFESNFQIFSFTHLLQQIPSVQNIYVPQDAVQAYKTASGWSAYVSKIKPIEQ